MLAVKARLQVEPDGVARVVLPPTVPTGEHEAVIVVEEKRPTRISQSVLDGFPRRSGASWLDVSELRREEIYGDDGR